MDGTWSMVLLDLNHYGLRDDKAYRYLSVVFDKFSRFGLRVPLKKKGQTAKDYCGNNLISSKRKSNLIENDDGKKV